jgi:uncharacterized protein YbjT (DUF2867 family)
VARFAALPHVTLFAGDLMVHADVERALEGVTRAMLVTGAFSHDQFETEAFFIEAAARKGLEVTVRVSTHSGLIKPGTKGAYGRAHHGIVRVVPLAPCAPRPPLCRLPSHARFLPHAPPSGGLHRGGQVQGH